MSLRHRRTSLAFATSSVVCTTSLAVLLATAATASAQSPWTVDIRPSTATLMTGNCTAIRLNLVDATGKEWPRNPAGGLISMADFDWSVAAGGAVVGRYDGAAAWSACACPASAGTVATITATYPAKALADKSRMPGVAFQSSVTVPVADGRSSGVPVGCEAIKTTTVPMGGEVAWTVTLMPSVTAIPIGSCSAVGIDLRDASGKEGPRNPAGQRVSLADFDMSVSAASGSSAAGSYNGATSWSACGCQGSAVGALATITATYPARLLADRARVPGVAFQSSISVPLAAARGANNPSACTATTTTTIASVSGAPVTATTPRAAPTGITPPGAPPTAALPGGVPGAIKGQPVAVAPNAPPSAAPSAPPRSPNAPVTVATRAGPAPAGVTVTGTPASATLAWQPVAGVASYVVTRNQGGAPPTQQTVASTNAGMFDSGLVPGTAYTYTVRAVQADGSAGSTDVAFTTPPAVNPSGFTAKQTGDGVVQLAWQPVAGASYYVVLGPGSINGGVKVKDSTTFTVTAVPVGSQQFAVGSYYDPGPISTPAAAFPRATVNVAELLSGWVDLHTHPMINLAFGGKLIHGGVDVGSLLPADNSCNKKVRAASIAQALGPDRPSHGGWNAVDFPCGDNFRQVLIGEFQSANDALVTGSPANGFPNFDQWPKWNDLTHQKMWFEWIRRARDGGLRVMVALATNNTTLGDAVSGPGDGPTDDKASADLQLTEITSFVARHNDFMEIAKGSADVKRIVKSNKIAVVLGVEVDNIGNFNKLPLTTMPASASQLLIKNEIQRLYDAGVRYVIPVHIMDNQFGGTAIYKNDFNSANIREAGYFWSIECADVADNITHTYVEGSDVLRDVGAFVKLGLDPLRRSGPPPVCPPANPIPGQPPKSRGHRNARTLTSLGTFAVTEMMKRGMIVDIDHMGQKTADSTLAIAEKYAYPIVSGHTGIRGFAGADAENSRTARQLERISKLHGMFGLGSDGLHSTAWARNYQQVMLGMGYLNADPKKATYENGMVGFGTDLNGLVKGPMPGGGNRVVYDAQFQMSNTGTKFWNYNTEGVAHYGMLADFVRDVRNAPSNGYIGPEGVAMGVAGPDLVDTHLMRSANHFWEMWERIESRKSSVP
ncbi:MAG: fibronectin type III domain-containing protein [Gemmatimonadaceae bacterium]